LSALAAGEDGLAAIRLIAAQCGEILRPGGTLLLEHGAGQQGEVATILTNASWNSIRCVADLAGNPRVTVASWQSAIDAPCGEGS
jgi:release factor glutamine methyltransferase